MWIRKIQNRTVREVMLELESAINCSRFIAKHIDQANSQAIKITDVRLKIKKKYHGSNANVFQHSWKKTFPRQLFLEGADWVEFNDLVNNVLDKLNVSAKVETNTCVIRKGEKRRITYDADYSSWNPNVMVWEKKGAEGHYVDNMGKPPIESQFPLGTPGIYGNDYYQVG